MKFGIEEAQKTMRENIGGPFGAVITDLEDNVICVASNTVLGDCDPTAHAEVNAIRKAGRILKTHDLSKCKLYATGYPCPMCLSAIIWANIKEVYFGCTPKDAEKIGFRDDFIYRFINNNCSDEDTLKIIPLNREDCLELFEEYALNNKEIY
ncbi:MAG: nucleoside deaminase [Clostridia bacterium]|nr:nucleoside deaminase [Clostridia bacterium]